MKENRKFVNFIEDSYKLFFVAKLILASYEPFFDPLVEDNVCSLKGSPLCFLKLLLFQKLCLTIHRNFKGLEYNILGQL